MPDIDIQFLGQSGIGAFRRELLRFPGMRARLLPRLTSSLAFTYYPSSIEKDTDEFCDGELHDMRDSQNEDWERYLSACYELLLEFLRRSDDYCLLVQADYFRLNRRDSRGHISAAPGERMIVLPSEEHCGYLSEAWIRLQCRDATEEDVRLTIARGMQHPRPFGMITEFPGAVPDGGLPSAVAEQLCQDASLLVYDAFDGQWPIFLALKAGTNERRIYHYSA